MNLFRKLKQSLFILILTAGAGVASAEDFVAFQVDYGRELELCDELYEQRGNLKNAWDAVDCYQKHLRNTSGEAHVRRAIHSQVLSLLSRLYIRSSLVGDRRRAVNSGLDQAADLSREFPGSGFAFYWKAVFISLDCELKDGGRVIPSCIMGKKDEVIALLKKTMSIEPGVHGNGADRVYGIMLREMPPLVGGDKELALKHIKNAYDASPNYSANHIEYARTLRSLRRYGEARVLLEQLVAANCLTMNPLLILECAEDQLRARDLLTLP